MTRDYLYCLQSHHRPVNDRQQLCNWPIGYSVSGLTEGLFTTKESAVRLFLKTRLVLDLIQCDCKPQCYYKGIETRQEKTDCWLFCSKQTLRQPRNGVTDWSIAQLLTDHWLVCGEIASNKNSHASQTTANNSESSSNLSNKTLKDIVQKETAVNFLKGNEFKAILPGFKESVRFSVVYVLFINRFKLLGFNWIIKLSWQPRCPQTEHNWVSGLLFFFLGRYALVSRGKRLRRSHA